MGSLRDETDEALRAQFDKLMAAKNPVKADPSCRIRLKCLEILDEREHPDWEPFLAATRCRQLEKAWGPPVDTAAALRGRGVIGLVRTYYPDVALVLGLLLADPEPPARRAAAQALAYRGDRNGAGMLLLRLGAGEEDPAVLQDLMAALLELAEDVAIPYLSRLLDPDADEIQREVAVLALGESRSAAALQALTDWLDAGWLDRQERKLGFTAVALHRTDAARAWLNSKATGDDPRLAELARDALQSVGWSPP